MKFKANKIILEYGEIEMYLEEGSYLKCSSVTWDVNFEYKHEQYEDTIFAYKVFDSLEEAVEWYNGTVEKYVVKE